MKQHLNILITEVSNSLTLSQKLLLPNNVFQYYPEISEGVTFEEEVDGSKSLPLRLGCYVYHYNP